jgi:NAD(P)-dependent dehydrogenase (short-subunit alcohol dehydrogenase family)
MTQGIDKLPAPDAVRGLFSLVGTAALVTGAARGLGRAIAWGLACHGADLVIADCDQAGAECLAEQVNQLGRRALPVRVDVTVERSLACTTGRLRSRATDS